MMTQHTMKDPRTQYPQPPFEKQPQNAPGLAGDMKPTPDHGEKSYVGSGKLEGRKALITGGDSGIGRATAIAYMREGAKVAINYLGAEESDAQDLSNIFSAEGAELIMLPGDVTNSDFCSELIERAADKLGGLDILVLNAGKQVATEDFDDISFAQFEQTYKTNIFAPFWTLKAASKHLNPGSAVIITSSIQGYKPAAMLVDYASTKAAERGFIQALGAQWIQSKGVRVNGVAPGPVWTPLQSAGGQPQEALPDFGSEAPINRPAQPAELAPAYVFLASQESSYVSGEIYGVTGGNPTS